MDKALKQRLVGASVLIALAVIVLPMLLSGRPESASQQTQSIELPPRPDELSFETRRFPVTEQQGDSRPAGDRVATPPGSLPQPTDVKPESATGSVVSEPSPAPAQEGDRDSKQPIAAESGPEQAIRQGSELNAEHRPAAVAAAPGKALVAQSGPGRYVVQVASLSSSENASRLMASLQEKGFPVLLDTIDSAVGRLSRIRVGPYEDESEAVQASGRIGEQVAGVNPKVVDLQPDPSAQAAGAADALARWVVQAGSFADASNAERLVAQLRQEGMSAYQEAVTSASARIFRVRIGPFLERGEALQIKQQLAEQLSIDGVVMTVD